MSCMRSAARAALCLPLALALAGADEPEPATTCSGAACRSEGVDDSVSLLATHARLHAAGQQQRGEGEGASNDLSQAWSCQAGTAARARLRVEARRARPLSFAFGGSGFTLPYYPGVVSVLLAHGLLDVAKTQFGGISGGAITSTMTCAGMSPAAFQEIILTIFRRFREDPMQNCFRKFSRTLKEQLLDKWMRHAQRRCGTGRVRVGMTALTASDTDFDSKRPNVVENFTSAADFEEALLTTSYLSCFGGPSTYTTFRGEPGIDGGYVVTYNDICPPDTDCVRISASTVGTNTTESGPKPDMQCFKIPSEAEDKQVPLTNWPRFQDPSWRLPTSCAYRYGAFVPPAPNGTQPDIYPGSLTKIKYSGSDWETLAMCVPSEADLQYMFQKGQEDTEAWYTQKYLPASTQALAQLVEPHLPPHAGRAQAAVAARPFSRGGLVGAHFSAVFPSRDALEQFVATLRGQAGVEAVAAADLECLPP